MTALAEPVRSTINKRDASGVVRHGGEWLTIWADPDSLRTPAEREVAAATARARDRRGRAVAATARAIAGGPLALPDPGPSEAGPAEAGPAGPGLALTRGRADRAALWRRHHDPRLHAGLAPSEGRARAVFDVLEGARCEALGVLRMPGILPNLAAAMAGRLDDLGLLRAHLAAQVPLVEALPMVALDALLDHAEPLLDSGAMEMWHRFARARFGRALAALRPHLDDQAAYAAATGPVLDAIFDAMRWDRADPAAAPERRAAAAARLPVGTEIAPGEDAGGEEDAGRGEAPGGGADAAAGYHRFSTAFDRIVPASALATPEELAALRRRLDASVAVTRAAAARLAHRLQRQLQAERLSAWSFDQEEGMLDTSRLDRVVTDPGAALSFKRERVAAERDTVVTLLIDNSGSMRGRPIALAAMGADLAARALERCGIALEVLGFTTAGWKGGETARRWAEAGRPPHPGRICDLLHIVYKSADQPYRQAREPMALMLRDGLLRENVDGEALLWAAGRLRARPERRRLLLVVSDGAPSDRATLDANDPRYLERHLREVARLLPARRIEVSAIGIGHPVDRVFPDAVVVAGPEGLAPALLSQLGRRLRR